MNTEALQRFSRHALSVWTFGFHFDGKRHTQSKRPRFDGGVGRDVVQDDIEVSVGALCYDATSQKWRMLRHASDYTL